MQITRLVLENLRAIERLDIDFSTMTGEPRRRVVLLGVNGAGKTTLLDAIAHAFNKLSASHDLGASGLSAADVRNVEDPSLAAEGPLRLGAIQLNAALSEDDRRVVRRLYPNAPQAGVLHFYVGEEVLDASDDLSWLDDIDVGDIGVTSSEPPETAHDHRVAAEHRDAPVEPLDDAPVKDVGSPYVSFEGVARAALDEARAPCVLLPADRGILEGGDALTLKQIRGFDPRSGCLGRSRERFAPIAARLALAVIAGRGDEANAVARMWKVIEKYIPEMPRLVDAEGMQLRFRNEHGAVVPLSALSDGERALLLIFGELALRSPKGGVVMIDELEQHLHPRWQRAALEGLAALLPSAQFIVTTQSPYLAACAPDDRVTLGDWERHGE